MHMHALTLKTSYFQSRFLCFTILYRLMFPRTQGVHPEVPVDTNEAPPSVVYWPTWTKQMKTKTECSPPSWPVALWVCITQRRVTSRAWLECPCLVPLLVTVVGPACTAAVRCKADRETTTTATKQQQRHHRATPIRLYGRPVSFNLSDFAEFWHCVDIPTLPSYCYCYKFVNICSS